MCIDPFFIIPSETPKAWCLWIADFSAEKLGKKERLLRTDALGLTLLAVVYTPRVALLLEMRILAGVLSGALAAFSHSSRALPIDSGHDESKGHFPAAMPASSRDLFLSLDGDSDGRLSLNEYMLDWDRVHDAMFEEEDTDSDGFVSRSEFRGVRGHRASVSGGQHINPLLDICDDNVVPRTLAWLRDKGEWPYKNMRNVEAVTRTLELLFSDIDVDWTDKQLPPVVIGKVDLAISTASSALRTFAEMKPNDAGRLLPPWISGVSSSPLSRRPATVKWVAEEVVHLPLMQYLIELYMVSRSAVVRSLILQFCDEVAWPGVPAQAVQQTSAAMLGLIPTIMELMLGFSWADVTLISHLSRAGHPTPALLLPRKSWSTHGQLRGQSLVHSYMTAFADTGAVCAQRIVAEGRVGCCEGAVQG